MAPPLLFDDSLPGAPTLGVDLRLVFQNGMVDLAGGTPEMVETVGGLDNLVQALRLRLLVDRGDLDALGHPRYGCRIRDLIGQSMDAANLELMRRYVRQALLEDVRVEEVVSVQVQPCSPDSVYVNAVVRAVSEEEASVEVLVHLEQTPV
jgi:phage baseplate assembly protein W